MSIFTYTNAGSGRNMVKKITLVLVLLWTSGSALLAQPSQGGTVNPASTTVCTGTNSGTLTLTAHTGTVVTWDSTSGTNWVSIPGTAGITTYTFTNLVIPAAAPNNVIKYRAAVQNGIFPIAYSSTTAITVSPATVAGTISGSTTVCATANTGTVTLNNHFGNILQWTSYDGTTWAPISNTTSSLTYSSLTVTTTYHAIVKSGICGKDSASATITVAPVSAGGTINSSDTVCSGSSDTLVLIGHTGTVMGWEYKDVGGWIPITGTNNMTTYIYSNLSLTTSYRAMVKSGVCPAAYSTTATITVNPSPNGGTLNGITTVCGNDNSGSVTVSGYTGTIARWDSSESPFVSWSPIVNPNPTENYLDLTTTTKYRVVLQLGGCFAYSSEATITVSPPTVGGSVGLSDTVCSGSNSGILTLTGQTGGIIGWQSSPGGNNWTPISWTNDTFGYFNNTTTLFYSAIVKSGACEQQTSSTATITVDPVSVGGILNSSKTVCKGINSGTITLTNFTGTPSWWQSTNPSAGWTQISNSASTWPYLNINDTTWYKVNVKSGVCPAAVSSTVIISPAPLPAADAGVDDTTSLGYPIQLNGSGGMDYIWAPTSSLNNPAIQNPIASPTATTTYTVMVSDANGCTDNNEVTIVVLEDYKFLITNLITPNGDGKNDTWHIGNIQEYPSCEVSIFNIHNTKLFSAVPYNNDWDGTFNGKELPDGTYYYILKCPDSAKESKGYITLLRNK